MDDPILKDLNETFQAKARLGIMTLLLSQGRSNFSTLKTQLGLTDGNLSSHLRVLEDAGYLEVEKKFIGRRPKTLYQISTAGREAFQAYLREIEKIIHLVKTIKE
mgnify:CR=1 FL=1